jgi:hypothetical protein
MLAQLAEVQLELGNAVAAAESIDRARQDLLGATDQSMRERVDAIAQRVVAAASANPDAG